MSKNYSRRKFFERTTTAGIGAALLASYGDLNLLAADADKPVALGGKPIRTEPFPSWPIHDQTEEAALLKVLRSGKWFRGSGEAVARFEAAYAELLDVKHCVATANGTSSLFTALSALGIGPGDEVIVPPYTFIATVNAVLLNYALPIFVDSDEATFQIDAQKIKPAISERTTAIIPVHLGGSAADLDSILAISREKNIPVIEDACQAHLAEWRGKKVGTLGAAGCFSFQASKNLNAGEGGAVVTNDDELVEKCYAFHNNCRARKTSSYNFTYRGHRGANLRMTEFQGGLLLAQMARLQQQAATRNQNAKYLTSLLQEIPGIVPTKMYEGCTRNAYHLYMFRYQPEHFAGLPRSGFLQALNAEGIPCSAGYSPLNTEQFLQDAIKSRAYQRLYPAKVLREWSERTHCPVNDKLCEEGVWFTQTMLLGAQRDMDDIAAAVRKIQTHAADLKKA